MRIAVGLLLLLLIAYAGSVVYLGLWIHDCCPTPAHARYWFAETTRERHVALRELYNNRHPATECVLGYALTTGEPSLKQVSAEALCRKREWFDGEPRGPHRFRAWHGPERSVEFQRVRFRDGVLLQYVVREGGRTLETIDESYITLCGFHQD